MAAGVTAVVTRSRSAALPMNTTRTRELLCARDASTGEYAIPRIIYADAYDSETVAFADLVLPDTTTE